MMTRTHEINPALLDSTTLQRLGYRITDAAHAMRMRAIRRLGMGRGDYGLLITLLRAATNTSGCVAGREWWRITARTRLKRNNGRAGR